jgi:tryptophan halogenase
MRSKKKIAIIGAGNAACATALHYYFYGREIFDSITIYYDPSVPIEKVGQGATLKFSNLISTIFNLNWYNHNPIHATRKDGILYENWGKKTEKIFHNFPLTNGAIHYVPQLLSKLLVECGLFNVVEKNIIDPEKEIDADYIFDCRGKHHRSPEDYETLINPLNHVILSRKEGPDLTLTHTRCVATPDGWTFVIPNYDSVSYGYLFNDTITDLENAKKNFSDLFDVIPDFDFRFENYVAKNCFVGERTILNGNKLSFLEPLEATSIEFYLAVARYSWDHIVEYESKNVANQNIRSEMNRLQNFVLWHYQFGSKYNTPFWEYAKSLPFTPDEEFKRMIDYVKQSSELECRDSGGYAYSQWSPHSFKVWMKNT